MLFMAPQVGNWDRKVGQEATCAQPKREMPNTQSSRREGVPPLPGGAQAGAVSTPAMGNRGLSVGGRAQGSFRCRACCPGCRHIPAPDNLPFLCAFIGHSGTRA